MAAKKELEKILISGVMFELVPVYKQDEMLSKARTLQGYLLKPIKEKKNEV